MHKTVILDCYTDEPSGYGVRPYLGSHQIHLSQALSYKGVRHSYLTIDDLRYSERLSNGNQKEDTEKTDISILQTTKNCENALNIINSADVIYIVMGCFVDYQYFSALPPKNNEVYKYLRNTPAKKILFYVLGASNGVPEEYSRSSLSGIIDHIEHGNTYRYILEDISGQDRFDYLKPNYALLKDISKSHVQIIDQLKYPIIAEIETGTGCNTPTCSYCIEAVRRLKVSYRSPEDIIGQVISLYNSGVRHFRLGRQPNFYHYQRQNVGDLERLLSGIRENCPDIETLHIDNANMLDVVRNNGEAFTQLIVKYCTSGNIAPLGIESFDDNVRDASNIMGKADEVLKAIEIINKYGQEKGEDGFPKLLPGINLIHGLPGQSSKTHDINLKYLDKILTSGMQTQRLFYRRMTRPTGISFEDGPEQTDDYNNCHDDIVKKFVLPMQSIVFPKGTILKNFREVVFDGTYTTLRTMGTCSIRASVEGNRGLDPYGYYNIEVFGNRGARNIEGGLV